MDPEHVRRLLDAGRLDVALALLLDAPAEHPATSLLVAEVHERRGDMLWFHDRPGAREPYRAAMHALLPGAGPTVRDAAEARHRQECWSRIATKLLHGTGPDGRRRPGASGRPHPHGDPPQEPPPAPEPTAVIGREAVPTSEAPPPGPAPESPQVETAAPEAEASAAPETPAEEAVLEQRPESRRPHREDRGPLLVGLGYRIAKSFRDFDGVDWPVGTELVYQGSEYSPRDEGLVLFFDRGSIRLCGLFAANSAVMERLEDHFAPAEPDAAEPDRGPPAPPV